MLLTLLLALGASDLEWIDRIVWGLAVASWLPQLLVASVVLRKSRPLLTQLLLLLSPLLLLATAGYRAAVLLLVLIYANPAWLLWLPVALLPTFGAMCLAVSRRGQLPARPPEPLRQASGSPGTWARWLVAGGLGLLLAAGIGWWWRPRPQAAAEWQEPVAAEAPPTRMELWMDSLYDKAQHDWEAQDRRAQLREDSLRASGPNPVPAPQPW